MMQSSYIDLSAVLEMLLKPACGGSSPILDEASVLHMGGSSGLSGEYQGGESISELLRCMVELTDGTLRFSAPQVLIADDQAIVLRGHSDATRGGSQLDSEVMLILSVKRGKVREMWVYHSEQDRVDDFWAAHRPPG